MLVTLIASLMVQVGLFATKDFWLAILDKLLEAVNLVPFWLMMTFLQHFD